MKKDSFVCFMSHIGLWELWGFLTDKVTQWPRLMEALPPEDVTFGHMILEL